MRFPRFVWAVLLGISSLTVQLHGAVQQDIKFDIARADTFYYQGLYNQALELLNPLDEKLKTSADSVEDKARVKMLIGLNEFALGNNDKARKQFLEFCNLIPNYSLDEKQYPTRVVTLFKEAQQKCDKCVEICARMETQAAAGNTGAVANMKGDTDSCGCIAKIQARDDAALKKGRD